MDTQEAFQPSRRSNNQLLHPNLVVGQSYRSIEDIENTLPDALRHCFRRKNSRKSYPSSNIYGRNIIVTDMLRQVRLLVLMWLLQTTCQACSRWRKARRMRQEKFSISSARDCRGADHPRGPRLSGLNLPPLPMPVNVQFSGWMLL